MPRPLTEYRVFIGSPGGLEDERRRFRDAILYFNEAHGNPDGVVLAAVGWEDTLPGAGRPQALINDDLRNCDYAIFVLHDRWGSATGNKTSGTEEEWEIAQELYERKSLRNISLFFKKVDAGKLRDPGSQLKRVLKFKNQIEREKKHLFQEYAELDQFCDTLEKHFAKWLRDHRKSRDETNIEAIQSSPPILASKSEIPGAPEPSFQYWLAESRRLAAATPSRDMHGSLFCAEKALKMANTDLEWAGAEDARGLAKYHLNDLMGAITINSGVAERFATCTDIDRRRWCARALFNKGVSLGAMGRSEEELAAYNDIVGRFGAASELPLRVLVSRALLNKGITLGELGRSEEELVVYDDIVGRFGAASEAGLQEQLAGALVSKGITLGLLERSEEEIAVYDDVVRRFGAASEAKLREHVAMALLDKGIALGTLERSEEEITVYDDLVNRFGAAEGPGLREQVATALVNKGNALWTLGRSEEAISVYDDVVRRFGASSEAGLREQVATALVEKGIALRTLGRSEEGIAAYDDVVGRFGAASEGALREQVANALYNTADTLRVLGRNEEAIAVYDDIVGRYAAANEPQLKDLVAKAVAMRKRVSRASRRR
jgi:tetratricopeptide (TPR) repeat protein